MSYSKGRARVKSDLLRLSPQPGLKNPSLIVGWNADVAGLGQKAAAYLNQRLGTQVIGEIEPASFFPMTGVAIQDDLVRFPESRFYASTEKNLVILKSDLPSYDWLKFLNAVLDAVEYYGVKEVYTTGAIVSLSAHTTPRELLITFNSLEMKNSQDFNDIIPGFDYETPSGQRPTLNSFLIWAAGRRNIRAASLWAVIPFYLAAVTDPQAEKRILQFLDLKFNLGLDLSDLEEEASQQYQSIAEIRANYPAIDSSISRLETNLHLSAEENQQLVQEIEKLLSEKE